MPARGRTKLIETIASAVRDVTRVRATASPEPWRHLDLTLPQLKALFLLDAVGPARISTVAQGIGVTTAGVTGLLDRLEERSLIRREPDPEDRRAVVVRLEPAGQELLDGVYSAGREELVEVLERMNEGDLRALNQGITALMAAQAGLREERAGMLGARRSEPLSGTRAVPAQMPGAKVPSAH